MNVSSIKRNLWLFKSAKLTLVEVLNILANKFIYFIAKYYYSIRSLFLAGDFNIIYDYRKHLNKNNPVKGRALLVFLRFPIYKENFIGRMKYFFSSNGLVINITRALNELGYSVDIIDGTYEQFISRQKYDVVIAHAINTLDIINNNTNKETTIIYFDTGAHWQTYFEKIKQRFIYFRERQGIDLIVEKRDFFTDFNKRGKFADKMFLAGDGIIVIGDQQVKSYNQFPVVFNINHGFLEDKFYKRIKTFEDLEDGRNNFLFLGGGTDNFRKGLDILFEVFRKKPDKNLYICAEIDPILIKTYNPEKYSNIHLIGYLKQCSKRFYEIIEKCNFVIQPSCNEGTPGGVLDCMQYGLIPIVTKECNIDVKDFGVLLDDYYVETISKAIDRVSEEQSELLKKRYTITRQNIFANFSEELFLKNIKNYIKTIIDIKKSQDKK